MCGIAGIATQDGCRPDDHVRVEAMLGSLAHRGPDDQHTATDGRAVIGSRRLSIIDLDTGRQPLTNEDDTIVASQNGEIYNYIELRDELQRRGHRFRTHGDTEVIVHAYEEHGDDFVDHLRGMFAIAIWDRRRQRLVLARDRLGKKPIYWSLADGRLTYGSELKAVLAADDRHSDVDGTSLALYLQYQYVPAPRSILVGIQKLAPASILTWDGGEPSIRRYWTLAYRPKSTQSEDDDREQCEELIRESVRLRLRSDVPVGVFLSGGMDSSVVTAMMAGLSERPVRTFSIGFDERAYDELPYARAVARHFGTDHTEEVVTLDAIRLLPALAYHFDEPFGDPSAIPTMQVAQLAATQLKVVLTGDGGDEAFGGYLRYRFQAGMGALARVPRPLQRLMAIAAQTAFSRTSANATLRRRADSWRRLVDLGPEDRYVALMTIHVEAERAALLGRHVPTDVYLLGALDGDPDAVGLDRLLRADTLTYLPEDLLVKMDRATMASSLEARAPLLDHVLVEFAATLPADRKLRRSESKRVLRQVARRLMPAELVNRPKMGFGVPIGTWFKGALGERYREVVLSADSRSRDHLDIKVAERLLASHQAGSRDYGHRLWVLLMFELWLRRWTSRDGETIG
jgi:asparagine synthase (glutamine-hydrolysing)